MSNVEYDSCGYPHRSLRAKAHDEEPLRLIDQLLNNGELGTIQTIPVDGDLIEGSSIEKPFMEIWVIMPDGFRLGVSLVMTPEQFLGLTQDELYKTRIHLCIEQLRAEYKSRMDK